MFILQSISVPFIVLLLLIAGAVPVYYKLYLKFHRKFVVTGKLQKKFDEVKEATETQFEVVKNATQRISTNLTEKVQHQAIKKPKQKTDSHALEKQVLKILAEKKATGMLDRSISDSLNLDFNKTKRLLEYLESKQFVESVSGASGKKHYLTELGKTWCQKKGHLHE